MQQVLILSPSMDIFDEMEVFIKKIISGAGGTITN